MEETMQQKNQQKEVSVQKIQCVKKTDANYPRRLRELSNMPAELFYKGELPDEERPTAAIVGARMCSAYGRIQAFRFAKELSQAGVQIISGLAYGIDSEGHRGALEGVTPTFAVMGNGADICYPARNRPLYERILRERGGIISEYPPGTEPRNYHFPARNRILSGLSDLVLVVEAKVKSGSLITAQCALEQGKTVFALPGSVQEMLSEGCHKLIYDGAGIAYSPEVLLSELGILEKFKKKEERKENIFLASDLKLVYSCFDLRPKMLDECIQETGLPAEKVSNLLLELELLGLIKETGRHYYVKQNGIET